MNIALVGWGIETKSAFNYYGEEHNYLIVNEEPRSDFPTQKNVIIRTNESQKPVGQSGNSEDLSYLENLENHDLIIYSPTARKNLEKLYPEDSNFWKNAKSIMHEFFEVCVSRNIVGVTGTKGKGTTTTLIAQMLEADGKTVHTGGNIGIPVLDILPKIKQDDWVILELSSFQLYKFPYSPHIAVHLMMIPEHIAEWHKTMDDYVESKKHIFLNQNKEDIAIYNPFNDYSRNNAEYSKGELIPYLKYPGAFIENNYVVIDNKKIVDISEIKLLGKHNLENVCAALTASWQVHQNIEAYRKVLTEFSGLEHRLQFVREISGIKYYNDSFGTTPDTSVVAMDSFSENKIMIIGGHDKGNDFSGMIDRLVSNDIKAVVCIGKTGTYLAQELLKRGFNKDRIILKENYNSWSMDEIIDSANKNAEAGDIVLLSTGSASFGIFRDYKERGEKFIDSVNSLV
jgi:UDP-N-acetylmuramoylalanine--D-glutamate ligase